MTDTLTPTRDDFAALLDEQLSGRDFGEGQVVHGRVVGIEVKSGSTVTPRDVAPLKRFAEDLGDRFVRGIVFYTGDNAVPFGKGINVLTISALWAGD
mgnify:CR=1 FL=1